MLYSIMTKRFLALQFHPTHMDRSEDLINQGAQWLLDGGSLDFTGMDNCTATHLVEGYTHSVSAQ